MPAFARLRCVIASALLVLLAACAAPASDPLASWQDGPAKSAVVAFVKATTDAGSPHFVAPADRLATFDQDGTLWVEHPLYTEVMFTLSRIVELAPKHPEWKDKHPFSVVLGGDRAAMAKLSEADLIQLVAATHTGVTAEEFNAAAKAWLAAARHPRWGRPYTELTYAPMQELLRYLRAAGFRTVIVSGGTQPFIRAFAEQVYGIPPEQVIGTTFATKFTSTRDGNVLMVEPKLQLDNNYGGKAQNIHLFTGRRPQAAFGNSSGDAEMLAYSQAGGGRTLQMLVLHDDAQREFAYGPARGLPATSIGAFPQSLLDEAGKRGWLVISMKNDWRRVFAWEP